MLNSTRCICGKRLFGKRFDTMTPRKFDDRFYGGRIAMEGEIVCECGRTLKGYFEQSYKTNGYDLIDLEVIKDITPDGKIDLNGTSCVDCEPETEEMAETEETEQVEEIVIDDTEDTYIAKTYDEMTYKELQAIAKEKGIKTNQKREALIEALMK